MKLEIRFGGFGGQGVILASVLLGKAVILEGKNAIQNEVYGPEKRGSLLRSDIIISDGEEINYAIINKADVLVAFSEKAIEDNEANIKVQGTIIIDSQVVNPKILTRNDIILQDIPALDLAEKIGNKLVYNVIFLGYLCKLKKIVQLESLYAVLEKTVKRKYFEINKKGIEEGYNYH
ncbi:MAG: 2-oxoacid:ferredoxin oxidoreductase subunit gamma [Candidatus Lokiarchaeota archaeon]|nr:2-oxoacid:ferredoxin oxidoreductase subunit gamma [Candidatus Lokiarchaeota archaeon]